jgi:hypothetical protein
VNTKFFFALLVIAIIATACAPIVKIQQPANPDTANNAPALIPVTGKSAAESAKREPQAPRLWSGEISTSDNFPDLKLDPKVSINRQTTTECMSEDSQPKQQSGCVE